MASSQKDPQKPYMELFRSAAIWMTHNHCLHLHNNFTSLLQVRKQGTFLTSATTATGVWVLVSLSQYQKKPFYLCAEQVLVLVRLIAGEMFVKMEVGRKSEGLGQVFFSFSTSNGLWYSANYGLGSAYSKGTMATNLHWKTAPLTVLNHSHPKQGWEGWHCIS